MIGDRVSWRLTNCLFQRCNLRNCNFRSAVFYGCKIEASHIEGADFLGASLNDIELEDVYADDTTKYYHLARCGAWHPFLDDQRAGNPLLNGRIPYCNVTRIVLS